MDVNKDTMKLEIQNDDNLTENIKSKTDKLIKINKELTYNLYGCKSGDFFSYKKSDTEQDVGQFVGVEVVNENEHRLWVKLSKDSGISYWGDVTCRDDFINNGIFVHKKSSDYLLLKNNKNNMEDLLTQEDTKDITINVKYGDSLSETFKAHKCILYFKSEYFKTLLNFNTKSSKEYFDFITINNIEPDVFKDILHYIYTSEINIKLSDYCEYYYASDYLQIKCLRDLLIDYVKLILETNINNLTEILKINNFELNERCALYLISNLLVNLLDYDISNLTSDFKSSLCKYIMNLKQDDLYCIFKSKTVDILLKLFDDNDLKHLLSHLSESQLVDIYRQKTIPPNILLDATYLNK